MSVTHLATNGLELRCTKPHTIEGFLTLKAIVLHSRRPLSKLPVYDTVNLPALSTVPSKLMEKRLFVLASTKNSQANFNFKLDSQKT